MNLELKAKLLPLWSIGTKRLKREKDKTGEVSFFLTKINIFLNQNLSVHLLKRPATKIQP
jgi:hypothetical protein